MNGYVESLKVEAALFVRGVFGFFFTFVFPSIMLILFGSIYGNQPSDFFGGRGAMDVTVPSYLAMVVGVNGLMSFPMILAEYKNNGVYKRFDATPAGKGTIIAAQITIYLIMTMLGALLLIGVGKALYNINIEGSAFAITVALLLSAACIFSMGFFIAGISRDTKITNLLCYFSYFIMLFASGASLPSEMFPQGLRAFSKVLPLTHVVDIMKSIFSGQSLQSYWVTPLILALLTLAFSGGGILVFRKKRWT